MCPNQLAGAMKLYDFLLFFKRRLFAISLKVSSSSFFPTILPFPNLERAKPTGPAPNIDVKPRTETPVSGVVAGTFAPATAPVLVMFTV